MVETQVVICGVNRLDKKYTAVIDMVCHVLQDLCLYEGGVDSTAILNEESSACLNFHVTAHMSIVISFVLFFLSKRYH